MKKYIFVFLFPTLWMSCAPDNGPVPGEYFGLFHVKTANGSVVDKNALIQVSEPAENSIKINGKTLSKKGYRIKGEMGYTSALYNTYNLMLDGKWRKKGSTYEILGDFTGSTQSSEVRGTFEMRL